MQFVDVKNDVAFRKIFGNENRRSILISFLNAIMRLEGLERITEILVLNPFQLPILPNYKASILDLKAKDGHGKTYIIEMQVANLMAMDKRLLYYTSKEYSQQLVTGEEYSELNPVIFIGIFDFLFTQGEEYLSHHAICNVKTGERIIKDMDFYFLELPKFDKTETELETVTDKWIYFIKEAKNLEVVPENMEDEGLKAAYADANRGTWTLAEWDAYIDAGVRVQDARGMVAYAEMKAAEKAVLQGARQIASNLKALGIPAKDIAAATGLSEAEIAGL